MQLCNYSGYTLAILPFILDLVQLFLSFYFEKLVQKSKRPYLYAIKQTKTT